MLIPSIDIIDDKIVHYQNGEKLIVKHTNYTSLIKKFNVMPEVNVIDLGAAKGLTNNKNRIVELCRLMNCNVGGGIRDLETAFGYLRVGAKHVIIGSKAIPEFLRELPKHRILVSLDLKQGKLVHTDRKKHWYASIKEKIEELQDYCSGFILTCVDSEGMGEGISAKFIQDLNRINNGNRIIVAGGITTYDEIYQLDSLGYDQVLGYALYTGKIDIYEAIISLLQFKNGLIPTIVQDDGGEVLMLVYSNIDSIRRTLTEKICYYYSRKRKTLWKKGEMSGNIQKLRCIRYDCDKDAIIYEVEQNGQACHVGNYSCFGEPFFNLKYLLKVIKDRIGGEAKSYTKDIAKNNNELNKKIIEEAFELVTAESKGEKIFEFSDLLYFILIYLAKNHIDFDLILNELSLRHNSGKWSKSQYKQPL